MSINKLAIIRSDNTHACPYGLPITVSCKNVGVAIHDMQPLNEVPEGQQEKYKQANRRVYRHSADGERCPFADKVLKDRDFVVCDYGDTGSGEHEAPLHPSAYYPRVFVGMEQANLFSYPMGSYNDTFPNQIYDGIFQSYATENRQQSQDYYEFAGSLEKSAASSVPFAPTRVQAWVHVRDQAGQPQKKFETDSLEKANEWARRHVKPNQTVDLEIELAADSTLPESGQPTLEQFNAAVTASPDFFRKLSPSDGARLLKATFGEDELSAEATEAREVWLESTPRAFLRYNAINGGPFKLQYRKIEKFRILYWFGLDGTGGFSQMPEQTLDFYTADAEPTNKTR